MQFPHPEFFSTFPRGNPDSACPDKSGQIGKPSRAGESGLEYPDSLLLTKSPSKSSPAAANQGFRGTNRSTTIERNGT